MSSKVVVIAEAGVNHNGNVELALELVDAAAAAGADAIKFQTFTAEKVAAPAAAKATYQAERTSAAESQLEMLRKLELSPEAHIRVVERCRERGITFLSTPFDFESATALHNIGLQTYKIGSGDLTNVAFLRHVGSLAESVILSTGMATMEEVALGVKSVREGGVNEITLLHCVTQYPAPTAEVNLLAMLAMQRKFALPVGYSDHTVGSEAAIAAVALGATVIEKHFTVSRDLPGPDHKASVEPLELKEFVKSLRTTEALLGDGIKRPAPCEMANLELVRRSIFAGRELPAGTRISAAMLECKRPGTGIAAADFDLVVGRITKRNFAAGEMLEWDGLGD